LGGRARRPFPPKTPPGAAPARSGASAAASERPRMECLFPPLTPSPSQLAPPTPVVARSRSEPSLPPAGRPAESVLSAVTTTFGGAPAVGSVLSAAAPAASAVSGEAPQAPGGDGTGRRSSGAADLVPYATSLVSSVQSGWRDHYSRSKGPGITLARGLLQQDIHMSHETTPCVCVIQQAIFPNLVKESPQAEQNQMRLAGISAAMRAQYEGLSAPGAGRLRRRTMSECSVSAGTSEQRASFRPWPLHLAVSEMPRAAPRAAG